MFILNVLGPLLLSIEVSDPCRTSDKLAVFSVMIQSKLHSTCILVRRKLGVMHVCVCVSQCVCVGESVFSLL